MCALQFQEDIYWGGGRCPIPGLMFRVWGLGFVGVQMQKKGLWGENARCSKGFIGFRVFGFRGLGGFGV